MPKPDATVGDAVPASQRRRAAARESILAAARALIAEEGFGGAQMSLIALRARVGVGSIYKHFESREELFAEIYSEVAAREFEHVEAAAAAIPEGATARIGAAVATFCTRALRAGRFGYAMLVEHSEPSVDTHRLAFREGYRRLFAQLLAEAIADGEIPDQDADTSAAALLGIMTETLVRPLGEAATSNSKTRANRTAKDADRLVAHVVALCQAAIQAPAGTSVT
jgi:AcrR family transcriptional regulator